MSNTGGHGREYRESDMRLLLQSRGPFTSWNHAARWLHMNGSSDPDLRPGDANQMLHDMESLVMDGVPYTDDPGAAYKLAHEHRHDGHHHGAQRREMPHRLRRAYPRT